MARLPTPLMDLLQELTAHCRAQEEYVRSCAGLSPSCFATLRAFPLHRSMSSAELAESLGLSASRCSRVVDQLVDKGYVARVVDPSDRRAVQLSLTERGGSTKRELTVLLSRCEQNLRDRLSTDQLDQVAEAINALLGAFETS